MKPVDSKIETDTISLASLMTVSLKPPMANPAEGIGAEELLFLFENLCAEEEQHRNRLRALAEKLEADRQALVEQSRSSRHLIPAVHLT